MSSIVVVNLLTYNRLEYAKITLKSVIRNLHSEKHEIVYHIADDGSPGDYIEQLMEGFDVKYSYSNTGHHSYGANYNLAMQTTHQHDYILPLEDDWELIRPLDVDELIERFFNDPNWYVGCIRLGNLGHTGRLEGLILDGGILLNATSPEQHVFAGHPRLVTPDWERQVGEWPEGLSPGDTELAVSGRHAARSGVLWPMDYIKTTGDLFVHIGTVRSTEVSETEIAHV